MRSLVGNRTRTQRTPASRSRLVPPGALAGGLGFDWVISWLSLVFLGGIFLDGWAHNHGRVDNSFFTIWHAFFYGGFLLNTLWLAATLWLNRQRGAAWSETLPTGYALSLLGVLVFAAGGVGDMLWHEFFGVEADFDALFSPTHLVLAAGLALMVTGPLRAAWARPARRLTWAEAGPALLSLAGLISVLTFLMMGAHPLSSNLAGAEHGYGSRTGEIAGTASVLLTTVILMGPLLLALRRWQLPAGSLIVVWGINMVAMAIVNWHHAYTFWLMFAMLVAVVVLDLIRLRLEPLASKAGALRLFAAVAPLCLMASYFVALLLTEGTDWSIHLWTGVVVEAGIAGWLLSYLVAPPAMPAEMGE